MSPLVGLHLVFIVALNIIIIHISNTVKSITKTPFHKPKEPLNNGQNKFLTSAMAYGLLGSFYYLFPYTGVFYFSKELYRTEIYIRSLEGEKTKKYYNTLDIDDRE